MKKILLFLPFLFLIISSFAQTGKIKGRIFDENNNNDLPFSNIYIKGTEIGTTSGMDGSFVLENIKPGFYILTVSSLGYATQVTEEFQVLPGKSVFLEIGMNEMAVKLKEVEVKANIFKRDKDTPVSLRKIGISEIENSPGANRDIAKVVQNLPGVAAIPAINRNDLLIRGGAGNEIKFYLDGVEIPNINHFATQGATGGTNGILNADFLREVNFYSSAFPTSKANALSAVFDFKQIEGNKDRTKFRGSIGASEVSLTADGPIGKNTTYIVSVRRSYLQFLFKVIGLPFLPTFNDYQLKVKTRINNKNQISLISVGALDHNRLDIDFKNPDEFQRQLLARLPEQNQWNYTIGFVWKHFQKNGYQNVIFSRNTLANKSEKYFNNDKTQELLQDYQSSETENKIRWESHHKLKPGIELNYGVAGQYVKYFNNTQVKTYFPGGLINVKYNTNLEFFKYAAFSQATKQFFGNRLTTTLGVRFSGSNYSNATINPLQQTSPQISASYLVTEKISVNAHAGRFYQLPSYTSLGYKNSQGVLINKETDLGYIQVDHLVGGIEYRPTTDNLLTVETFYKKYNNYPFCTKDSISLAHRDVIFGILGAEKLSPSSEGRVYGVEVLSQNRFPANINFILSYTFSVSQFKDKNGEYQSTTWDNRHILIATLSKRFKNDWFAGLKFRFAGGLPYTPYDLELSAYKEAWNAQSIPYYNYDLLTSKRFAPFHQLDIRVDKTFNFTKSKLKIYLDIQNIYNFKSETNSIWTNLDQDGNVMTDPNNPNKYILREIESDGLGTILPTIGVIFDF